MNVATPQSELYEKLLQIGWTLKKIDYKRGVYVAKAKNETTGQEIERTGKSPEMALASVFRFAQQAYAVRRHAAQQKLAAWSSDWLSQTEEIGQAYAKMPPFDEKAVPAWKALAAESKVQADAIRQQINVQVTDDPEPYMNARQMCEDVHKNKRFIVSRANSEHPIWSVEDNVNFRIVHDVLGHCQSGGDFSWQGENMACGVHFPLVSPLAREALFTECIGQQAYYRTFHGFGPQKVGFMSQFLHPVQENEGEHVWVPHGGVPQLAPSPNMNEKGTMDQAVGMQGIFNTPGSWVDPTQFQAPPSPTFAQPTPVMQPIVMQSAKMVSPDRPYDPNQFWTPPFSTQPNEDPSRDYIGIEDTVRNAAKIDTNWPSEDEATQKRAIMNAFRVALLSPRKHLKWNAAHYQALMHADPSTPAVDLWNMLEDAREKHNQKLGYPEGSHLAYKQQLSFLAHELQVDDPQLSSADAMREAKEVIFKKTKEYESILGLSKIVRGPEGKLDVVPLSPQEQEADNRSDLRRYNEARKLVTQWLRDNYTPVRGWQPGQMAIASANDIEQEIARVAEDHKPEGGYGEVCWNPETKTVLWVPADWSSSEEIDAAHKAFLAIPGVEKVEGDAEQSLPYKRDDKLSPIKEDGELVLKDGWVRVADTLFDTEDGWAPADATGFASEDSKYGAFMGTHLDAIEQVGKHIDQIRDAALKDLDEGGKGFTFRNAVMNMNLPGVNPKVASFAWLLLAPMSSELGIIDTHVIRGLRRSERDMNPRDYYKMERMQRAAKDATGYSHMPLGMYHWGLWDAIRNPGEHSDHSPLRILDPLAWDSPEAKWDASTSARSGPWVGPQPFEDARGHMERAALDFDKEMAGQPSHFVPLAKHPGEALPGDQSLYMVPSL